MRRIRDIRRLLALLIGVATLAVVALIGRHFWQEQGSDQSALHSSAAVDAAVRLVHFTELREGLKRWELTSATAEYDKTADSSRLTQLRFMLFDAPPVGPMTITADSGNYHHGTKDVQLIGNVRADNGREMSFATGRVTYVAGRSLLATSDRVTLTDGNLRVQGVGMELFTNDKRVRILHQVVATITPGER